MHVFIHIAFPIVNGSSYMFLCHREAFNSFYVYIVTIFYYEELLNRLIWEYNTVINIYQWTSVCPWDGRHQNNRHYHFLTLSHCYPRVNYACIYFQNLCLLMDIYYKTLLTV